MRFFKGAACAAAIFGLLIHVQLSAAAETSGTPAIFFPEKSFEFQPAIDGAKVVHDFVVMNKGQGGLTIENVKTG